MTPSNFEIRKRNNLRQLFGIVPELKSFEPIISQLFSEFYLKKAIIIIDPLLGSSHLGQTRFNTISRNFELFIGTREREPLEILWSIFHEYGHLQQDRPTSEEATDGTLAKYLRERNAWEIGQNKFLEFDILKTHLDNFEAYRSTCQSSYKVSQDSIKH